MENNIQRVFVIIFGLAALAVADRLCIGLTANDTQRFFVSLMVIDGFFLATHLRKIVLMQADNS